MKNMGEILKHCGIKIIFKVRRRNDKKSS